MSRPQIEWPKSATPWIEARTLFVSVPFTWCLPELRERLKCGDMFYDAAVVGGPAMRLMPDYFADMPHVTVGDSIPGVLQRINPLATRTTVGCPNRCAFCAVPITEGSLFHPYITHCLTVYPRGRSRRLTVAVWRGDEEWPASIQLTYRWRRTVYWHIWFVGLTRHKGELVEAATK